MVRSLTLAVMLYAVATPSLLYADVADTLARALERQDREEREESLRQQQAAKAKEREAINGDRSKASKSPRAWQVKSKPSQKTGQKSPLSVLQNPPRNPPQNIPRKAPLNVNGHLDWRAMQPAGRRWTPPPAGLQDVWRQVGDGTECIEVGLNDIDLVGHDGLVIPVSVSKTNELRSRQQTPASR